jgi:hypothetical protein
MEALWASKEGTDMRLKIVGFGHFVTDTWFKFEGAFAKDLKMGDVIGYLDPETLEMVEVPEFGQRVAMVVPVSLEDSELEELYALPDDRPQDASAIGDKTNTNFSLT